MGTKEEKVKYSNEFRRQVLEAVEECMRIIRGSYAGDVDYMDGDKQSGGREGYYLMAEVDIDDRYLAADFKVYPEFFRRWRRKKRKYQREYVYDIISHEVSHIVTEPLYSAIHQTYKSKDDVERAREQTTELISRLVRGMWKRKTPIGDVKSKRHAQKHRRPR